MTSVSYGDRPSRGGPVNFLILMPIGILVNHNAQFVPIISAPGLIQEVGKFLVMGDLRHQTSIAAILGLTTRPSETSMASTIWRFLFSQPFGAVRANEAMEASSVRNSPAACVPNMFRPPIEISTRF